MRVGADMAVLLFLKVMRCKSQTNLQDNVTHLRNLFYFDRKAILDWHMQLGSQSVFPHLIFLCVARVKT